MAEDQKKPTALVQEILDKFSSLITAAFGLVAALAWNEAIKAIFIEIFGEQETLMPMISYAIVVTILAVIFTFIVARAISKAKEKSSKLGL
jgi:high-affinity Fe2+/Pb2+ permease